MERSAVDVHFDTNQSNLVAESADNALQADPPPPIIDSVATKHAGSQMLMTRSV